jgi:WD40 repeat protein
MCVFFYFLRPSRASTLFRFFVHVLKLCFASFFFPCFKRDVFRPNFCSSPILFRFRGYFLFLTAPQKVVCSHHGAKMRIYDLRSRDRTHLLKGHGLCVNDFYFNDDFLISASKDQTIRIWVYSFFFLDHGSFFVDVNCDFGKKMELCVFGNFGFGPSYFS